MQSSPRVGYADFHEMLCVDQSCSENGHKMCWVGTALFFHDLYGHISSHLTS
jgi:hypothetical protein